MTLKVMRLVACSAFVAALAGCGNGGFDTPKVADGAVAVIASGNVQKGKLSPTLKKVGASSDLIFEQAPKEVKDLFAKVGIEKLESRWTMLTIGGVKGIASGNIPRVAFAVSFDHDLNRIISALQNEVKKANDNDTEFKQTKVAGVDAWEIYSDDFKTDGKKIVPCVASLGGKLFLVTSSSSVMEQQIALYRDGKGASKDFADFIVTPNDLLKVSIAKVGDSIRESLGDSMEMLEIVNNVIPDGDKMLLGVGTVQASISAVSDTECHLRIALNMASEDDADKIRTLAKTGLMAANAQMKKAADNDKDAKSLYEALQTTKIGGAKASAELTVSFSAAPILEGLMESVRSSQKSANSAAQAMRGRNLFVGILQADTERAAAGLASVWPRTRVEDASIKDPDIADIAFSNATDYFNILFDRKNCTKDGWEPYVSVESEVVVRSTENLGGLFQPSQLAWSIAANVSDEMSDIVPVLVSANFDPSQLLGEWDGETDRNKLLKTTDGKDLVIVRKGGASEVFKPQRCTYSAIYKNQEFTTPKSFTYLTAKGSADPRR